MQNWPDTVRRAGHAIKGAAANLMCHGLNKAAMALEAEAKAACPVGTGKGFDFFKNETQAPFVCFGL